MASNKTSIPPSNGAVRTAFYHSPLDLPSCPLRTSKVSSPPGNTPNIPVSSCAEHPVTSSDGRIPIKEDDIVIAVMGPTGAGKSSFINIAAGREEVAVGYGLTSQTRTVQPVRCSHPDGQRNIVLVDTPGFDDTHLSDVQVLTIIANWLKETYRGNIRLSGLLYFHRISDVRFSGTPLRNLSVFKDLCGETNLRNVVLVTTMWDELDHETGSRREENLITDFWKDMIRVGSQSYRFHGTRASAWDIIERLDLERPRREPTSLQIQKEMVDHGYQFYQTTAAKTLLGSILQEIQMLWRKIRSGTRRLTRSRPFGTLRKHVAPSTPSTSVSSLPESSSHVSSGSRADTPSAFSCHPSNPTESTFTCCSADDRRHILVATITGLRLAHQVADTVGIPILRGAIGTALNVAQLIEGVGGTHHAIGQVIDQSGWLLHEIAQYAAQSTLSEGMTKSLKSFTKELENVQKVVIEISRRSSISRFFLHDAQVRAIVACTESITAIHAKLEVKIAIDSRHAVARLEDQLKGLRDDMRLCQCHCELMNNPGRKGII